MSVEGFVISALIEEKSPKRAFQEGITELDFELYDDEFRWIVNQHELRKPVNARLFKKKFPEFDLIQSEDKLTDLIEELKQERAYITISSAIDELLSGEEPLEADNAIAKAQQLREILTDVLRTHAAASDAMIFGDITAHLKFMKQLQALRENGEIPGIPTGIRHVDHHCGGLQKESTTVVLGRPGDAKSMFLAKFAIEATWHGYRVGVFSPEMTEHQHRCRFATLLSAKPEIQKECGLQKAFRLRALKDGYGFNYKAYKRFMEWCQSELKGGEIALFTPKYRREKMTPQYIEARTEDLGLDLVIVDPIYKLKSPRRRMSRWEELGEIVDNLTDLAHAHNIPVVMSNQANRALVGNKGEPPTKDTSYGSDAPSHEGEVVMGVKHYAEERILKVNCSKNRHGETFKFSMAFFPNVGRMEDVTPIRDTYLNGYDAEVAKELRKELQQEVED
jgi:replicative DNA helicase